MSILSPLIKKYHNAVDQLRDARAELHLKQVELADINRAIEEKMKPIQEKEKAIVLREKAVLQREQELEASIDRTHMKLADSVDVLNKRGENITREIANKEQEAARIAREIDQKTARLDTVNSDLAEKKEEVQRLNIAIVEDQKALEAVKSEKDRMSKVVEEQKKQVIALGEEEAAAQKRKADMELFATRLRKLYKEQGIDIEI